MTFGTTPVTHVGLNEFDPPNPDVWPATLAPVQQVLREGLDLGRATIFVGENGSGKSTLVEGIAMAYGVNPEGGSTGAMHHSRPTESNLHSGLRVRRNPGASKYGYFLRSETMHGFFTYLEDNPSTGRPDIRFHEMSHGESFLQLITDRFRGGGLWILDEPESALSFSGCLSLLSVLTQLLDEGDSQVILSTHAPMLASLPGANIYEVGRWGLRPNVWEDLELVQNWRSFMDAPQRFLKYL
ncbi:ATPase AAA [Arthrobacter sp. PAMC 25486]|uniref:AAA family ATPase n=1 Tax=Arthrobacter sp. PAMC 25486 TaxID=1494608 RepID=UPI0005360373|nr:ATP-binding cassette domain-containing protein [Arthrobacter sp. PAMC 25486]AIY00144.1 ATPase AAA [Arthrobacter sp. PAMC 25486]